VKNNAAVISAPPNSRTAHCFKPDISPMFISLLSLLR
jgi:hypothetical protein